MSATALYAYAVVEPDAALPSGSPLTLVAADGVAAVVGEVDRAAFEPGPDCRTNDPDWVAAAAAAHHAVVAECVATGPALPLAFGALFSGPMPLQAWLMARVAALRPALGEVAGCEEWGLALMEDAVAHAAWLETHDTALRDLAAAADRASEGTRFLLERRRSRALTALRANRHRALGEQVGGILAGHARRAAGAATTAAAPTLSWTGLVPRAAVAMLRADLANAARDLAETGMTLALSGPWPAYAFAREALRDA